MDVLTGNAKPKLAAKARLKPDAKTGRHLLLYPEAGLDLNRTGTEILKLCDGVRTLDAIAGELARAYPDKPRDAIEGELRAFLQALLDRGLVQIQGEDP